MIPLISLSDLCVSLKSFSLTLNEKESGNFFLGRLLLVFPPCISSMGRNFRLNVIPKAAVIDFLNDRLLIATCFDPLHDSVWLATAGTRERSLVEVHYRRLWDGMMLDQFD